MVRAKSAAFALVAARSREMWPVLLELGTSRVRRSLVLFSQMMGRIGDPKESVREMPGTFFHRVFHPVVSGAESF